MENMQKTSVPSLSDLIGMAKAEEWDSVNDALGKVADSDDIYSWASTKGLSDKDGNVRDLAASVIEVSSNEMDSKLSARLAENLDDKHPYARFRAACALASKGHYSDRVVSVLEKFTEDEDEEVSQLAQEYLDSRDIEEL